MEVRALAGWTLDWLEEVSESSKRPRPQPPTLSYTYILTGSFRIARKLFADFCHRSTWHMNNSEILETVRTRKYIETGTLRAFRYYFRSILIRPGFISRLWIEIDATSSINNKKKAIRIFEKMNGISRNKKKTVFLFWITLYILINGYLRITEKTKRSKKHFMPR